MRLKGKTSVQHIARGINLNMLYPVVDEELHHDWIQFLFVHQCALAFNHIY